MFTESNTDGFSKSDLELLNAALDEYMARQGELTDDDREQAEKNASDRINNNWQETGNTVETLLRGL